jgi:hypothetical protein
MKKHLLLCALAFSTSFTMQAAEAEAAQPTEVAQTPTVLSKKVAARVASKAVIRALFAYVNEQYEKELTFFEHNKASFQPLPIIDPVADLVCDELMPLQATTTNIKIVEWLIPHIIKIIVESKTEGKKGNSEILEKLIFSSAKDACSKKKLFLPEDHELRKTLNSPLVAIGIAAAKLDNGITAKTDCLTDIAISLISESTVDNVIAPKVSIKSKVFANWINSKKCRKDFVKTAGGELLSQLIKRTLVASSQNVADRSAAPKKPTGSDL